MITTILAAVVLTASLVTLIAPLLPLVVDAVAKSNESPAFKSLMLAGLGAVATVLEAAVIDGDTAVLSTEVLARTLVVFAIAIASFFGLLKPTGISDAVENRTASFGVGRPGTSTSAGMSALALAPLLMFGSCNPPPSTPTVHTYGEFEENIPNIAPPDILQLEMVPSNVDGLTPAERCGQYGNDTELYVYAGALLCYDVDY